LQRNREAERKSSPSLYSRMNRRESESSKFPADFARASEGPSSASAMSFHQPRSMVDMRRKSETLDSGHSFGNVVSGAFPAYQEYPVHANMPPLDKKIVLYKTEMCRSFEETGTCKYGLKCQFAHNPNEIRSIPRHPRYKTEICKTFWQLGNCPYGKRCCFIHTENEARQFAADGKASEAGSTIDLGDLKTRFASTETFEMEAVEDGTPTESFFPTAVPLIGRRRRSMIEDRLESSGRLISPESSQLWPADTLTISPALKNPFSLWDDASKANPSPIPVTSTSDLAAFSFPDPSLKSTSIWTSCLGSTSLANSFQAAEESVNGATASSSSSNSSRPPSAQSFRSQQFLIDMIGMLED
jgi:hypothetical protein